MPSRCTCNCAHVGGAYQRPCSVPGGCGSEGCDGFGNIPDDRSARDEPAAAPVPPPDAPPRPDLYGARGVLLPPDVIRARLEEYAAELGAWRSKADEYTAAHAEWKTAADEVAREGGRVVLGLGAALPPAE